jgi:site-specific recombinase XerD
MTATLANVLSHVSSLQHRDNAALVNDFYAWMKENDKSEAYIKNNLKAIVNFAQWLYGYDASMSFSDVKKKDIILLYLDTKIKSKDDDPDGKWITTWNDYLNRIKAFYRWLHNYRMVEDEKKRRLPVSEWQTPDFLQIKHKKSQRPSPYSARGLGA